MGSWALALRRKRFEGTRDKAQQEFLNNMLANVVGGRQRPNLNMMKHPF